MLYLIFCFSFITMFLLMYAVIKILIVNKKAISRLKGYTVSENSKVEKTRSSSKDFKVGLEFLSKGFSNSKFLEGYKKDVQQLLTRAHLLLKPEEYISICIILLFLLASITFLISGSILLTIGAAILGWLLPGIVLKFKIKKRTKQLNEQLSDAIVLISNSLKAGFSFFQAADTVAKEMKGPIGEEFLTMQKETNLGVTTEKALENIISRVSSDDFELVITAVQIQRQVGGNLAEVLDNISSTIRERIKIKGEVKTITAQGRMSGLVISVLPPGIGFIIYLINPEYIGTLFKNPIGIMIIVFSIMMELLGIFFIKKIVKIEL